MGDASDIKEKGSAGPSGQPETTRQYTSFSQLPQVLSEADRLVPYEAQELFAGKPPAEIEPLQSLFREFAHAVAPSLLEGTSSARSDTAVKGISQTLVRFLETTWENRGQFSRNLFTAEIPSGETPGSNPNSDNPMFTRGWELGNQGSANVLSLLAASKNLQTETDKDSLGRGFRSSAALCDLGKAAGFINYGTNLIVYGTQRSAIDRLITNIDHYRVDDRYRSV